MGGNQKKTYFYAVRNGRSPGVYKSWAECESNVKGFQGAKYKKFENEKEARDFANLSASKSEYIYATNSAQTSSKRKHKEIPTVNSTCNINRASNSAKVISPPQRNLIIGSMTKIESPRITPQVGKRKFLEEDYSREYKQPKFEHAAPQYNRKKVSVVYTDGASSNNGKDNARAGFGVYWGDNDPRNASVRLPGTSQTNQRAEASAVNYALEQSLDGTETLEIRTDSQYVINAITSWYKKWVTNGWKSSNGKVVENKDLFEKMLELKERRKGEVKFVYVPGHQGVEGNEKADQLAVAGARK